LKNWLKGMIPMVEQSSGKQTGQSDSQSHEEAIVPIRPGLGAPGEATAARPATPTRPTGAAGPGAGNRWVFAALGLLVLIALGVVFVLPRWVEQSTHEAPEPEPAVIPQAEVPQKPAMDPELLAALEARAEQSLARLLTQQGALESMAVERWGGEDWPAYLDLIREGDDAFLAKAFDEAVPVYEEAQALGENLLARADDVLAEALDSADAALAAGDAEQAAGQFDLALAIQPDNQRGLAGLERAGNLPQVLVIMAAGQSAEAAGRLAEAAEKYQDALALDGAWEPARVARAAVLVRLQRADFDAAMSAGLVALGNQEFDAATQAFQRALKLRPGAQEALDGLTQADQGRRLSRISLARVRATAFERQERWDDAIGQYRAALALDEAVSFAREGLARAAARADLEKKLVNLIDRPRLLFSDKVLADARRLLAEARQVSSEPGPRLGQQISTLDRLVTQASTPVSVRLFSDNLTEVTVYRVRELGTFDVQQLDLRPGRYTVVGSRDGYRDVRQILEILPGAAPEPLTIQCVDRI
jgi:tetratricopeptide (TPR) repeat protein